MEKPMPGCMGRVVNLFDLGPSFSGNRLLTEKAHHDRSHSSRDQEAAKKVADTVDNHTKEKLAACDLKINKKSSGTPTKMLIAQEMLKEPDFRRKPPSVVARLMGLDALPPQNQILKVEESLPASYTQSKTTKYEAGPRSWSDKVDFPEVRSSQIFIQEAHDYKDVYEVQHQAHKTSLMENRDLQKTKQKEDINEKMALVRQKFMEAKCLSMDEKLRHSKEFQDALDVLSSNRDVFLKFLQEPNSLLSNYLYELPYLPTPAASKRITVLRPAKVAEEKEEKPVKRVKRQFSPETNDWNKNSTHWGGFNIHLKRHNTIQKTRIVVLKPSPGKVVEVKSLFSPTSLRKSHQGASDCNEGYGIGKTKQSKELAKDMTLQMRKNLSRSYGDDSFLSSALSNGYVGDQSSVSKSDTEDVEEDSFSDSDIMTPTSKHSWDFIRRYDSPFSSKSFSRASHSPESSVSREAKKRLSDRWAMMAMNKNLHETQHGHGSASTLGDMLSIPEAKVSTQSDKEVKSNGKNICSSKSCGGEQELGVSSSGMSNGENMDKCMECSPRSLVRSRSAPLSLRACEMAKSNVEAPCLEHKTSTLKDDTNAKNGKSSIKDKVSSFFFSRNKKPNKDRQCSTSMIGSQDPLQLERVSDTNQVLLGDKFDDLSACASTSFDSGGSVVNLKELNNKPSSLRHGSLTCKGSSSLGKTGATAQLDDNREQQPSPVSVLDALLDEKVSTHGYGGNVDVDQTSHLRLLKSCDATAKSPLIESVTRSLSRDGGNLETSTLISSGGCTSRHAREVAQEQDWFQYVRSLLAAASLEHETSDTVFTKWHSLESPLEPSLSEKCNVGEDDEQLTEAKRIERRSDRKLKFDSVNAALLEMVVFAIDSSECVLISSKAGRKNVHVMEEVWGLIKERLFIEPKICVGESEDGHLVEKVVRKEVVGKCWEDLTRLEVDKAVKEIEMCIFQELIEALEELA